MARAEVDMSPSLQPCKDPAVVPVADKEAECQHISAIYGYGKVSVHGVVDH